jgi:hypothetical protein
VADPAISGIVQLEGVRSRLRRSTNPIDKRDADMALALQQGHFVYLLGATFVGIAFSPYMLIAAADRAGARRCVAAAWRRASLCPPAAR